MSEHAVVVVIVMELVSFEMEKVDLVNKTEKIWKLQLLKWNLNIFKT